jgi:hypothetical protein
MAGKIDFDVSQVLDGAVETFGQALKAGVKAQEEIVKWWSNSLNGGSFMGDWQKRSKQFFDDTIPATQKQAQEWMKLAEQNYRRSVELLKKAVEADPDQSFDAASERVRKLWEESLAVIKENAEAMVQTNAKLMDLWAEQIGKKMCEGAAVAAGK